MKDSFQLQAYFNIKPETLFKAWMSSEQHQSMTSAGAEIGEEIGSAFEAWDGYIMGKTIELIPFSKIVQNWRTTEFDEEDEDSRLEIVFAPHEKGSILTLIHTNIPQGQGSSYRSGWEEFYFEPMREYFNDDISKS